MTRSDWRRLGRTWQSSCSSWLDRPWASSWWCCPCWWTPGCHWSPWPMRSSRRTRTARTSMSLQSPFQARHVYFIFVGEWVEHFELNLPPRERRAGCCTCVWRRRRWRRMPVSTGRPSRPWTRRTRRSRRCCSTGWWFLCDQVGLASGTSLCSRRKNWCLPNLMKGKFSG